MTNFKTLGEIASDNGLIVDGDWVESKDQDPNGNVRLLQLADIGVGRFIDKSSRFMTEEKAKELKCTFLKEGDILIARMPDPIGRACIFPGSSQHCVTVVDVCIFRVNPEEFDNRWLMYMINSTGFYHQILEFVSGTTRKRIARKKLEQLGLNCPPLETQQQIATVLEKADQLRKDCQQMEQELNSLAQSVFIDMFGDPVTNPKGWGKKELLSLCSKVTDGTHQSPEWANTGVPFLFISNVRNGKVDFDTGKYITRRCYEELTRTSPIEVDDILYTTVGSYGHVALVKDSFPDFCFQRHIAHIKPDPNKIIPEFLYYQLQTSGVKHLADLAVKGIAQKTLNLKDLKKFEMIVPPEDKQLELINYMNHQYQALNELEQMKSEYEMLFNSLMQKAFKGELDL
ncbi:TPA: restriction endonuclease subunit S [Vibrio parahaemolyticus]